MATVQPYAEIVGQERIAPRLTAAELSRSAVTPSMGGHLVSEELAHASGDIYSIPLSPADQELLSRLRTPSKEVSSYLRAGVVNVSIGHLRDLPPDTRVRIGYVLRLTEAEIEELGI